MDSKNTTSLTLFNETYVPIPVAAGVVGFGGTYEWFVTAEKAGIYQFNVEYKRAWDDESADAFFSNITFR